MKLLGALFAMTGGALATLTMLVLLVAGSPNSTPEKLAEIQTYMWLTGAAGLAGLVAALWGLAKRRYGFAAGAGLAPLGFVIVLFAALLIFER